MTKRQKILRKIAQHLQTNSYYTLDDEEYDVLGLRDAGVRRTDDPQLIGKGQHTSRSLTYAIYRFDEVWAYVEYEHSVKRVKEVGVPKAEAYGLDEEEFRREYEAHRETEKYSDIPPYTHDLYEQADTWMRKGTEVTIIDYPHNVGLRTDGHRVFIQAADPQAGLWDHVDLPRDATLQRSAIERSIDESHDIPGCSHLDGPLPKDMVARVEYDATPLLKEKQTQEQ